MTMKRANADEAVSVRVLAGRHPWMCIAADGRASLHGQI